MPPARIELAHAVWGNRSRLRAMRRRPPGRQPEGWRLLSGHAAPKVVSTLLLPKLRSRPPRLFRIGRSDVRRSCRAVSRTRTRRPPPYHARPGSSQTSTLLDEPCPEAEFQSERRTRLDGFDR